MNNQIDYIDYARLAIDTIFRKFTPDELPPKKTMHYHQGVFLNGVLNFYNETKEERYFQYIKDYIDVCIEDNGMMAVFDSFSFDDIQAGTLLFPIMEKVENMEKYKYALMACISIVKNWRRDKDGGFWHKQTLPNQMWLDGIYMVSQLQMMYAYKYKAYSFAQNVYEQIFLMYDRLKTDNGLLYHGWTQTPDQPWCNKETGCSLEVWARALGWYTLACLDVLELDEKNIGDKTKVRKIIKDVLESLVQYQDKDTGMWYQIVDKPHAEDNWLESSGSALFVYSIAKAVRLGILDEEYLKYAEFGFEGLVRNAVELQDNNLFMNLICVGTNVGTYDQYIHRPTSCNDLHGLGPFILMCMEMHRNKH